MKTSIHAVETKNLSIEWGDQKVLNKINLKLNEGDKIAIVGPSGSGKSTILKILAGLILPTDGELKIFGEKQRYLRLDQLNPPDVRLVFQNPALLGSLTIEENVGFILNRNKKLSKNLIGSFKIQFGNVKKGCVLLRTLERKGQAAKQPPAKLKIGCFCFFCLISATLPFLKTMTVCFLNQPCCVYEF